MIKINLKNINEDDLLDKSGYYIFCLKKDKKLPDTGDNIIFSKFKSLNVVYAGITGDSIASRVLKKHIYGNGGNSTLRKSIGSMLGLTKVPRSDAEKIKRDKGKSFKTKFNDDGESIVSEWIESNLILFVDYGNDLIQIEEKLINDYNPPLNIDKNNNQINYDFRRKLSHPNRKLTSLRAVKKRNSKPFVKWAGGKYSLADRLIPFFPSEFNDSNNTYYEPMVGSGGFFFKFNPKNAYLSDVNENLIKTYNVIKDEILLEELINLLYKFQTKVFSKEAYNELRKEYNKENNHILTTATLFIFLNKMCYNGLYRENSKGHFNVPRGDKDIFNFNAQHLRSVSKRLKNVQIECHGYENIEPKKGDFVYFDPPYISLDKVSFTQYSKNDFGEKDHRKLASFCSKLDDSGVKYMISNSNTEMTKDIYVTGNNIKIKEFKVMRTIAGSSNKRGLANEIIIKNY